MPIHLMIAASLLALTPPLSGLAILLFSVEYPPRIRTPLAIGTSFLLVAFALAVLGSASALLDGRQPFFPYLTVTGLPALIVLRVLTHHLDWRADQPSDPYFPNLLRDNLG